MTPRSAYPSDVSDARWALIEPVLAEWRKARLDRRPTGKPAPTSLREIFNAILYLNRTGIAWKYLPHDFPPHHTVCPTLPPGGTRESSPGSATS
jgi:transposase